MEPRVSYEGGIILTLGIEVSALGPNIEVAGRNVPSFQTRRVSTRLRLREGVEPARRTDQQNERKSISGFPGLIRVPVFKQLFSATGTSPKERHRHAHHAAHRADARADAEDLAPMFIGTQGNIGLGGPPPPSLRSRSEKNRDRDRSRPRRHGSLARVLGRSGRRPGQRPVVCRKPPSRAFRREYGTHARGSLLCPGGSAWGRACDARRSAAGHRTAATGCAAGSLTRAAATDRSCDSPGSSPGAVGGGAEES